MTCCEVREPNIAAVDASFAHTHRRREPTLMLAPYLPVKMTISVAEGPAGSQYRSGILLPVPPWFEGHLNSPPTTALGSISPELPKQKCAYSCPQRDGANRVLIAKVNALGYEQGYSIFECVYTPPEAYDDARTCWYHKTSGKQALSSKAISCPVQAPSCKTPSSSFSYTSSVSNPPTQYHKMPAKPLFSKQDDIIPEIPTWVETGRYLLWVKEHSRP